MVARNMLFFGPHLPLPSFHVLSDFDYLTVQIAYRRAAESDLEHVCVACRTPWKERVSRGGGGVSGSLGLDLHSATVARPAATGRGEIRQ